MLKAIKGPGQNSANQATFLYQKSNQSTPVQKSGEGHTDNERVTPSRFSASVEEGLEYFTIDCLMTPW
jgi:hypothetical protein